MDLCGQAGKLLAKNFLPLRANPFADFENEEERSSSQMDSREIKKRQTHRYDHISLLRFRPGEVLQELVARRRRKDTMFFYFRLSACFAQVFFLISGLR